MDLAYKLQVKIGQSEFNGEGPEATVKDAVSYTHLTLPTTPYV